MKGTDSNSEKYSSGEQTNLEQSNSRDLRNRKVPLPPNIKSSPDRQQKYESLYPEIRPEEFNQCDSGVQPSNTVNAQKDQVNGNGHYSEHQNKQMRTVIRSYTACERSEVTVKKGAKVVLVECNRAWCKVYVPEERKEGYCPLSCLAQTSSENNDSSCFFLFKKMKRFWIILAVILLSVILGLHINGFNFSSFWNKQKSICEGKTDFECLVYQINQLESKYDSFPDKVWTTLTSCLSASSTGMHPCVVLMLNDGKRDFSHFLQEVGVLTTNIFRHTNIPSEIIMLEGSKLTESHADNFFTKHKCDLEKKKVMVVNEMEKVPGKIMELFHSFCDVYDPAVRQAVILFLLNHQYIPVDDRGNDATFAINLLNHLWKDAIHKDIIDPLAIRVAENVIRLK